jgi:uncharacterized protein YjbI with pentapeptide repeats
MEREEALALLSSGSAGVEEWNRRRREETFDPPNLSKVDLARSDLTGADFSHSNLSYSNLQFANLQNANLAGANLYRTTFSGAQLAGANLSTARLHDTDLSDVDLAGARFFQATIAHVDFRRARLLAADFTEGWLIGGQFTDAVLTGARFGYSYISCLLHDARDIEGAQHVARSRVSVDTLRSFRSIPYAFLRGCGLQEEDIAYLVTRLEKPIQLESVFISYSHADQAFAEWLHGELQRRGIRCWLDRHDLKPGDRVLDAVDKAIRLHDRVLLCCSRNSLMSWWVKDEFRKAQERERRENRDVVIPILLDRFLLDEWSDGLATDLRSRKAANLVAWASGDSRTMAELGLLVGALESSHAVST